MPSKYPDFIFERAGHWCFYRNKALEPIEATAPTDAESPISPLLSERQEITSSQHSHVCKAILNNRKQPFPVYLKGMDFKSPRDVIKQQLSKSRAINAFEAELLLQSLGFGTPTTLLTGWRQRMLFFKDSFFTLSAALTDYEDLYTITAQLGDQSVHQKRAFIEQLSATIARMHRENIGHGDLRAGNVMCKYSEEWHFSLIDNERTRKYRKLPERIRIKNLVQLNLLISPVINKTDRQRFFDNYSLLCYGQINRNLLTKVIDKTRRRLKIMVEKQKIEASDLWL
ncbi:MAG: lipopolysaccharide kinase InaA family protein [Candidatus Reddybacter sp.]